MNDVSYAYMDDVSGWEEHITKARFVDFLAARVPAVMNIENIQDLQRIRFNRCKSLRALKLSNLPSLTTLDVSYCEILNSITIENCPNLLAIDASFCVYCEEITGTFPKLQYLNIFSSPIDMNLVGMNDLLFLDNGLSNTTLKLSDLPSLEVFSTANRKYSLSEITNHPKLKCFSCFIRGQFNADSISENTQLKVIYIDFVIGLTGDISLLTNFEFDSNPIEYRYIDAEMLLYGPWPTANIDARPPQLHQQVFNHPQFNTEAVVDGITGAILGSALFDMMGVGVEFNDKTQSYNLLNMPLSVIWSHPRMNHHCSRFLRGTSTDDTSQAILIMRSLVKSNSENIEPNGKTIFNAGLAKVDLNDFGKRILEWMKVGHPEHKQGGGLGIGRTVFSVITHKNFLIDPIASSFDYWDSNNRAFSANGSVMRNAPCGCIAFWDEPTVIKVAELFGKVTHADPRCVFSTVSIALLISRNLQVRAGLLDSYDIDETIEEAKKHVEGIEDYDDDTNYYSHCKTPSELMLSEKSKIGYSLKAYGSAIWALRYCQTYEEAIINIIREGGDSDTNGAVVGALMGSKLGYSAIPNYLRIYMFDGPWIMRELSEFLALMGLETPTFEKF